MQVLKADYLKSDYEGDYYEYYDHTANRQIKKFCDQNGVKMLDFFNYLPNDYDYMEQRIRNTIG